MAIPSAGWRLGRVGWLALALVAATLAVNVAGVRGITRARHAVLESSRRFARLEAEARARGIESTLSTVRADLRFLGSSPALTDFAPALLPGIGADLILFLRGHPEVTSISVRSATGTALLEAGRPRGVPGYWIPSAGTRELLPETPASIAIRGEIPGTGSAHLAVTLDGLRLVGRPTRDAASHLSCALADRAGVYFASEHGFDDGVDDPEEVEVATEGWSVPAPWRLRCLRGNEPAVALLEPIASRYRGTILLNLLILALALALGLLAIRQARRREWLEARAQEHSRVRELERQLFHAERLGTVGRLAAGMAHEINNPLEGLANYLRLARDAVAAGEGGSALRHLDRVDEGARRAAAIVRRVLDHADPATPPLVPTDLNAVLLQALEFVRARDEFGAIRFHAEVAEPALVRGSALMLGQVFLNLLLNACEAQPNGGEVRVRSWVDGHEVVAEVADRGPGIPQSLQQRVFEPFHSTKNSSGLGLSICDTIVRQHGGTLSVESRPEGGSVFRVRLASISPGKGTP